MLKWSFQLISPVMKSTRHEILMLLLFGAFSGCNSLQTGIVSQYFTKTGARLEDLASQTGVVFSDQDWVTSGAMCATACWGTDWCSGYLVCRDRPGTLCVFVDLHVNSGQTAQNTSDYTSCFLYMPAGFQWTSQKTTISSTSAVSATATALTTLSSTSVTSPTTSSTSVMSPTTTSSTSTTSPTTTSSTTVMSPTTTSSPTTSSTSVTSPTTTLSTTSTTSATTTPFIPPSFCSGDQQLLPSTSNGCEYGRKQGCSSYYKNCQDSFADGHTDEAIYLIKPDGYHSPFKVLCSGGDRHTPRRTHIQRNWFACCPTTSFNQSWAAYRDGFGDLENFSCSYWLGNEKIAALTAQWQFKLVVSDSLTRHNREAIYSDFKVEDESCDFTMRYSSYDGRGIKFDDGFTTVDTPNQDLNGAQFYTYDHDNDAKCAATQGSGWWFDTGCARVNLNTDHDPQWYVRGDLRTYNTMYIYLE